MTDPNDLTLISREKWGAAPPLSTPAHIEIPTDELWLHHTGGNEAGAAGMRAIQHYHQHTKGWSDIGYTLVVDPDLMAVFVGRGIGIQGAHTAGHNRTGHGLCVMGNFETERPTSQLIDYLAAVVAWGHRRGLWPAAITGGHRDVAGTACPGRHLYAAIGEINARAAALLDQEGPTPMPLSWEYQLQDAILANGPTIVRDGKAGPETCKAAVEVIGYLTGLVAQTKTQLAEVADQAQRDRNRFATELAAARAGTAPEAAATKVLELGSAIGDAAERLAELAKLLGVDQ